MIRLELKPNESVDKAMRRFKKICDREGLTRDMRKHSYFEKPSDRNKRKNREAEKERAKALRMVEKKRTNYCYSYATFLLYLLFLILSRACHFLRAL